MEEKQMKTLNLDEVQIMFPTNITILLYNEIKDVIKNGELTRSNVVFILLTLMKSVEKFKNITGIQKKAIVLDVLNTFIDENISDLTEASELKLLVQLTIPSLIDTLVSIDTKEIKIKLKKSCKSILWCFF